MPMVSDARTVFRGLAPRNQGLAARLEEEAAREDIPIVGPVAGRLLTILTRALGASRVLELGTATGYSALHLAWGMRPGGRLVSLEADPATAARARANLAQAGLAQAVEVLEGTAQELLPQMSGSVDLVFLDIDKGGYASVLPEIHRLLRPGGLLVADNTAFTGAQPFNKALEPPAWWAVNLLCFLPGHSPEQDGLALALRGD